MRVLHLVPAAPFGGAQRLAIDLAQIQSSGGLQAEIGWLNEGQTALDAANEARVPNKGVGRGTQRIFGVRSRVRNADIVHVHLPPPWLAAAIPSSATVVIHLHVRPALQVHAPTVRRRIDAMAEQRLVGKADRLLAISEWVAAAWQSSYAHAAGKTTVVYNGVVVLPSRPTRGAPEEAAESRSFTIAAACRLADRKGIEELLDAASAIHAKDPSIQFRIAGDGPSRGEFESKAASLGLGSVVRFEGHLDDMDAFWSDVDLAAFTPPFEPFGLRLIEPLARGVPVIAYRNGSGSDEILDRCRGVVSVPYADADRFATEAVALKRDPARLRTLSETGFEDVRATFSIDTMARATEAVYRDLTEGAGRD